MSAHALSPKKGHGTAVQISWGLVQIPVRLHLVADDDRSVPKRSMFTPAGNPVGYQNYDKVTGEVVAAADTVKKAQVTSGEWVELTDDEIQAHSVLTPGRAEIVTFVPVADVTANYVVEKYGTWIPESMKVGKIKVVDPTAAKAAALLRSAMAERDVAALVMLPTRGGGQYVTLFADGRCGWMVYAENVRPSAAIDEVELTPAEKKLAAQLIDGIGIDTPVLHDEAGVRIRTYLEGKATGEVSAPVVEAVAPAIDLMAALEASLAAAKPVKKAKKAS